MAVTAIGFLMRLPDVDGLREVGTVLAVTGAVTQGVFFLLLGGTMSAKRWNACDRERRGERRRRYETPPRGV